jgi:hypothetical protein
MFVLCLQKENQMTSLKNRQKKLKRNGGIEFPQKQQLGQKKLL